MRISPIKSIIRNLTDQKFTTPVNSGLRIVVTAKNTPGDTAKIVGDVFTLMDRTDVVEALASAILDGRVSLEYVIDGIATVTENGDIPNINSSVAMQERVKNYRTMPKKATITDQKPAKAEEPVIPQQLADTDNKMDNKTDEATMAPEAPTDTETKDEQKPAKAEESKVDTPAKPQRKQRQIKIN